jgi:hypothetical protein
MLTPWGQMLRVFTWDDQDHAVPPRDDVTEMHLTP